MSSHISRRRRFLFVCVRWIQESNYPPGFFFTPRNDGKAGKKAKLWCDYNCPTKLKKKMSFKRWLEWTARWGSGDYTWRRRAAGIMSPRGGKNGEKREILTIEWDHRHLQTIGSLSQRQIPSVNILITEPRTKHVFGDVTDCFVLLRPTGEGSL